MLILSIIHNIFNPRATKAYLFIYFLKTIEIKSSKTAIVIYYKYIDIVLYPFSAPLYLKVVVFVSKQSDIVNICRFDLFLWMNSWNWRKFYTIYLPRLSGQRHSEPANTKYESFTFISIGSSSYISLQWKTGIFSTKKRW